MNQILKKITGFLKKNPNSISNEKLKICLKLKELKKQTSEHQKQKDAVDVFSKIVSTPEFQSAKSILIYWSSSDELPTQKFIADWKDKKSILLPIVIGDRMEIKRFTSIEKLKKGYMGIWEPFSEDSFCGDPDLILVPGVAFDMKKNRLGRGKGYYDRYFHQSKVQKWGIGYDFQLLKSVPINEKDVPLDKIFTPLRTVE
jgi:5-formyltetrahydrofolate cyclo-ligase